MRDRTVPKSFATPTEAGESCTFWSVVAFKQFSSTLSNLHSSLQNSANPSDTCHIQESCKVFILKKKKHNRMKTKWRDLVKQKKTLHFKTCLCQKSTAASKNFHLISYLKNWYMFPFIVGMCFILAPLVLLSRDLSIIN